MILFILSLFFFSLSPVKAQDINQYQSDYRYQLDLFQKSYQNYLEKEQIDNKYSTLSTQKDKTEASINALLQRNQLLYSYLILLRVQLGQYDNNDPRNNILKEKLLAKETYLKAQDLTIKQLGDKEQVKEWSTQFKSQYPEIQTIIYSTLVQIQVNQQKNILQKIQILGQEIQADSPQNQALSQWLNELPTQSEKVTQHLNDAILDTEKKQTGTRFNNFYSSSLKDLDLATNLLSEMHSNLKSVVSKFITL